MYKQCAYCGSRTEDDNPYCGLRCKHKKEGGNERTYKKEVRQLVAKILSGSRIGQAASIIAAATSK